MSLRTVWCLGPEQWLDTGVVSVEALGGRDEDERAHGGGGAAAAGDAGSWSDHARRLVRHRRRGRDVRPESDGLAARKRAALARAVWLPLVQG